jgi:hypothetical protein
MLQRYRPDHSRRHPQLGSPCLLAPDPEIDNVCSKCGGAVAEVPMMLLGSENAAGDFDAWVYCDYCAGEILGTMRRAQANDE